MRIIIVKSIRFLETTLMPPPADHRSIEILKKLIVAYAYLLNVITVVAAIYANPNYFKQIITTPH